MPPAAVDQAFAGAPEGARSTRGDVAREPGATEGEAVESLAQLYERSLASPSRRRSGSHYTTPLVAARIAEVALRPMFDVPCPPSALDLTVCDPSMGGGACLLAALRWLARRAVEDGAAPGRAAALERIAGNVHGVDVDPIAAGIARLSLWLEVGDPDADLTAWATRLRIGDGLDGAPPGFPDRHDVVLGNPPWVSFVGRAAQPLEEADRARYTQRFAAFAGYRNLQGLFLERGAAMLRPGGRMAFLVPSSMSEQIGYAPTRRAVARHVAADAEMHDVGEDAFVGVVQPCMIFAGTRRADDPSGGAAPRATGDEGWSVSRSDLDAVGKALLAKLSALAPLPPASFGERGVQTTSADAADLAPEPDARRDWPLLSGTDVGAFRCGPPALFAEKARFSKRFRDMGWGQVRFVVRQTAMYPIAAHARGEAFRNSLLAGFSSVDEAGDWSADFLVGWLNASPIRWLHFHRFRDARQGLPQVKVGHLRSVPRPVTAANVGAIAALARRLGHANAGITTDDQASLDAMVGDALELTALERRQVAAWAAAKPTPVSRRNG